MTTRDELPQGYEPHELPPDYTGSLWIEGQMRRFGDRIATAEREACAKILLDNAAACIEGSAVHMVLTANAKAILARGQA